ncbi:MAG: alpha/beta hydrolase [Acutalibacteraceae bacterium]|nr:alpha/beta hydrolase [Acutalibacteraceae bacterium]
MKKLISVVSLVLAFVIAFGSMTICSAVDSAPELKVYEVVNLDGVNIEYGIYGDLDAEPLLLLPPNGGDMHSFDGSILPEMAKHFKVICVSPRATGKSDWVEGGMTFEAMADDLANLLDYLNIEKTRIFGFSDGGNLGVVFTLAHQERVESLVIMGSNINTWGTNTFDQIQITYQYIILCIEAWLYDDIEYARRRDIKGMMVGQPSLTFEDISAIKVPVFNIYGEHDMIQRWHSKKITRSIEGAQELMIIGGGHSTCFDQTETVINPALLKFYGVV